MARIRQHSEFAAWFSRLRDATAFAQIAKRIVRLALGNPGDVAPVGDGVSEMRIHGGPGYGVYFVRRGEEMVILPCGGDKSSPPRDIRRAKALAASL
ncbi:type II toxin-antitoxin system RelE/ParE family toxin [Methylobacterium sp. SyP6R]|uniref:type II toxin-antitoxin system RelE/ParE family toxin n=1 Tax=Methylobacterium sp. SyP6R TaxID=2718876 RepID=UPI001F2A076A|nr:type II toxin-antitoxin system RelE/ParE family toxin [Methylobacterium sp. SyP6R]MCF4124190.1 type II toxin-antitoxin system RelE/ParE family toxin [Methylobacterium sp. SyP6R]